MKWSRPGTPARLIRLAARLAALLALVVSLATVRMIAQTPPGATPGSQDPSLAQIESYQASELAVSTNGSGQKLAEAVNIFEAQKKGTFHGSLYEFHRNDNFDARNFFDPVGPPLPEYKRNQFGGDFGAILGRFNIFASYDALRIIQGSTELSHVPSAAMKRGDFSELLSGPVPVQLRDPVTGEPFVANQIPENRFHPAARRMLPLLPDPNRSDVARNFVNNEPVVENEDTIHARMDVDLGSGRQITAEYAYERGRETEVNRLPAFTARDGGKDQELRLKYNASTGSNLVWEAEIELERETYYRLSKNAEQAGLLASLGIPGISAGDLDEEGFPVFELAGYQNFGDENSPQHDIENTLRGSAVLTYVRGNHKWDFFGQLGARQINDHRSSALRRGYFTFNKAYSGDSFADFLLGAPDSAQRAIGSLRSDLRHRWLELSVDDEWKLDPRLTLSLELSYQYVGPYRSTRDDVSVFSPFLFEPPPDGRLIFAGSPDAIAAGLGAAGSRGMVFPDRNDWAPEIGLAYRPMQNSKLVLRSYCGFNYENFGPGVYTGYMSRNYPFAYQESAYAPAGGPGLSLSNPFQSVAAAELEVRGLEPNLRTPYINFWGLTIENQLNDEWKLSFFYAGSKGTGFGRPLLGNVPLPGEGDVQSRRPNPAYGLFRIFSGSGSFIYHGSRVVAERALNRGVSLRFQFRWHGELNDLYGDEPSNPRNLRAERAWDSYLSRRREVYLNYIVDLPFGRGRRYAADAPRWLDAVFGGWRLSGINRFSDGQRFSAVMPGDWNSDGLSGDRPDRGGTGNLPASERTIDRWFAAEDFAPPLPYSFGNAGRNILVGPGYKNWDLSLIKEAKLSGGRQIQLRCELFNAFNQVNFERPENEFDNSTFGKVFGAGRAREIEMAVKYSF